MYRIGHVTVCGGGELQMFLVLVDKSLDEIDLLERQLNGVQVLRLTGNVGGPELQTQSKVT
jgi:hypothetical protein